MIIIIIRAVTKNLLCDRCYSWHLENVNHSILKKSYEVGMIIPISLMRQLRQREFQLKLICPELYGSK